MEVLSNVGIDGAWLSTFMRKNKEGEMIVLCREKVMEKVI